MFHFEPKSIAPIAKNTQPCFVGYVRYMCFCVCDLYLGVTASTPRSIYDVEDKLGRSGGGYIKNMAIIGTSTLLEGK